MRFYLPAWSQAWKRIRALGDALPEGVSGADQLLRQVLDVADKLGLSRRDEAVRHACHVVALGRDRSSKCLTAAEADRVVCLFRLLADPLDLGAMVEWEKPRRLDRTRLLWRVNYGRHKMPYVWAVARDKFGEPNPERLSDEQLHDLVRTLANR
jgi:hypothetical protein